MALGPEYCKQIKENLRLHANFPPNRPVALGDYGVVQDHVFERLGNLGQLGITFATIPGTGQSTYQFKSKGNVDFALIAKGDVQPGGVPAVKAGLELKFSRENAVFFNAAGCTVLAIADLRAIESELLNLHDLGQWKTDFYVVTEFTSAARVTIIASADRDSEVKLEASSPAIEAIHLGDASLDLSVKRSRNTSLEIVTEGGLTPLIQLCRLRGVFRKEFRPEALMVTGAPVETRLAPDSETEPSFEFASMRPARESVVVTGPAAEPETEHFRASILETSRTDFEVNRAISAYIPLLQASYAFAHGNENPPLPNGYEIIAPIRVQHQEAMEALPPLEPEARAAVDNDFLAMAREQVQVEPGRPIPEAIPSPDAFGFVFREKLTGAIIVSIRGTQTPGEWVKNFTAVPNLFNEVPDFGLVHLGFESLWRSIRPAVFTALAPLPATSRITMLGHSLGGAMVTLGAVDVKKNLNRPVVDLCTVGGPRAGMIRFRVKFNGLIDHCFRVTETRDIVPHVPPGFLGWNHVGLQIAVKSKVDNPHSLESYLEGLQKIGEPMELAPAGSPLAESAMVSPILAARVL
jgi:hypothetical protein